MRRHSGHRTSAWLLALLIGGGAVAQEPESGGNSPAVQRLDDRIRVLRQEADDLAQHARTLVGDLRTLQVERDLRMAEATQAAGALAGAEQALNETSDRLAELEEDRAIQVPALRAQLVDLYKHGRAGYGGMIFAATDLREIGRAIRTVGVLISLNHRRIEDHLRTLEALQLERATLETQRAVLADRERAGRAAQAVADRAVKAHAGRIAEIDSRRDLTAQYTDELQVAREQLLMQLAARVNATAVVPAPPIGPFQGALEWPVPGTLTGRFGETSNRLGGTAVRNGIDIAAPLDSVVRAVHDGTVAHAGPFTGFGTLVILDHGGNHFSLYGYLSDVSIVVGDAISSGAELGRVGHAPAGPSALYFELRIDGQAVDPLQWLQSQ